MTPDQSLLFQRITEFPLDEGAPELSFAARLAKDNGWRIGYALRAIEEYRRFAFLMVASGHMAVPSDQVDQVWHQHLLYTRSWAAFCGRVLGREIHHEPARPGVEEGDRFRVGYEQTLESYRHFFGEFPEDIWPVTAVRFGRDTHYERINKQANLVIPRDRCLQLGVTATVVLSSVFLVWMS